MAHNQFFLKKKIYTRKNDVMSEQEKKNKEKRKRKRIKWDFFSF